jgi:hypothetical protein
MDTMRGRFTHQQLDVLTAVIFDVVIGLGWLVMSPNRTAAPAYEPAKMLLDDLLRFDPIRFYGYAMAALALCVLIGALSCRHGLYRTALNTLSAYWLWWGGMWTLGMINGGSIAGAVLGIGFAIRHMRLPERSPWEG